MNSTAEKNICIEVLPVPINEGPYRQRPLTRTPTQQKTTFYFHLFKTITSFYDRFNYTLKGCCYGLGYTLTMGKNNDFRINYLVNIRHAKYLFANPFFELLQAINLGKSINQDPIDLPISAFINDLFNIIAKGCNSSKYPVVSIVVARITPLIKTICMVAARLIEGTFAIVAVPFSLLTFGYLPKLEQFAYKTLFATAIIEDVLDGLVSFVKPDFNP